MLGLREMQTTPINFSQNSPHLISTSFFPFPQLFLLYPFQNHPNYTLHSPLIPLFPLCYNNNLSLFPNRLMQYINTRPLTFIVNRVRESSRVQPIFDQINQACHINLKFQCPETVLATAKRINQREVREKKYKPSPQKLNNINWVFGEFKIFVWTVVYKCLINGLQLQHLTIDIAKEIQNIFKSKSLCFIQYEIKLLISQKYNIIPDAWQPQEIDLLSQIMATHVDKGEINWRGVSFELFFRSNAEYFRNINHCREKWFNHLNPIVKKGDWTTEEDIKIFRLIKVHGLKWSKISKSMGKIRTEHMVKNRFNKYYKLWKLDSESSVQMIYRLYKEKIEKPYLKKMRDSGKQVDFGIKMEEEEKEVEDEEVEAMLMGEKVERKAIQDASAEQILPTQESIAHKDQTNELTPPKELIPIKPEPSQCQPQIKTEPALQSPYRMYYPFLNLYYPPLNYAHF